MVCNMEEDRCGSCGRTVCFLVFDLIPKIVVMFIELILGTIVATSLPFVYSWVAISHVFELLAIQDTLDICGGGTVWC